MYDDDIEENHGDDETEDGDDAVDLPEFTTAELFNSQKDETKPGAPIFIQERRIPRLAHLVALANKDNRRLIFENCIFTEVRIHASSVDMQFEDSLFAEKVRFGDAVFAGNLQFWETRFAREAQFNLTKFKEDAVFEECTFSSGADFSDSLFEKNVAFRACDFEQATTFENTRFAHDAAFTDSTFWGKLSFRKCQFEKRLDLTGVEFKESPDTSGSNMVDAQKTEPGRPGRQPVRRRPLKERGKKAGLNRWGELDKVSGKPMTRRHLLRGLFRFLPEDKDE